MCNRRVRSATPRALHDGSVRHYHRSQVNRSKAFLGGVAMLFTLSSTPGLAHGTARQGRAVEAHREQLPFGVAGDRRAVTRAVVVSGTDTMRFTPSRLDLKVGETVRLVLVNRGAMLHELVLGTEESLKEHAGLMARFPGMQHDEPHMVHVRPGKRGQIIWRFNKPGEFRFGCLVPGHFEAGMVGSITVSPSAR